MHVKPYKEIISFISAEKILSYDYKKNDINVAIVYNIFPVKH